MRIFLLQLAIGIGLLSCSVQLSCGARQHPGPISIDCTVLDPAKIQATILTFALSLAGGDWTAVEQEAIAAGVSIGGCALAEVVQKYLAPPPGRAAAPTADGRNARATLERFRTDQANGATFHTRDGDL